MVTPQDRGIYLCSVLISFSTVRTRRLSFAADSSLHPNQRRFKIGEKWCPQFRSVTRPASSIFSRIPYFFRSKVVLIKRPDKHNRHINSLLVVCLIVCFRKTPQRSQFWIGLGFSGYVLNGQNPYLAETRANFCVDCAYWGV